jgi:hypothetical protein
MASVIRLRGTPSIEIDGVPVTGPRGRKSWAVLALAVLSDRPLARGRVARLLSRTPVIRSVPCAGRWPSCAARSAGLPVCRVIRW